MHSRVAQDVLAHFALRDAKVGGAFEPDGFWRLATARGDMTEEMLGSALTELVNDGCVVESGSSYFLTQKGYEHIHGHREGARWTQELEDQG